jgi:ubiquinone/menaquinone biosynthesis C-methylase UbiE
MPHGTEFHGTHAHNYGKRPSFWNTKSLVDSRPLKLASGQRVLDIGAGTGTDLEKLFARYGEDIELYGVEPSQDMLDQLSHRVATSQHVHLSNASADKLPYEDGFFDYVMCSLVLHHMSETDRQKALQEMYRVLKPGGTVLIKEWGQPQSFLGHFIAWFWRNHAYVSKSTSDDLPSLLKQANFKQVKVLSVKRGVLYQLAATK